MNEHCRNERAASVLQGRSISTIHSSLITKAELRRNLSLSFQNLCSLSHPSHSVLPFSLAICLNSFSLLLNLALHFSLYFFSHFKKIFNGMKENENHVSRAPLHGSLGRTQYFVIAVSPVSFQCSSAVFNVFYLCAPPLPAHN